MPLISPRRSTGSTLHRGVAKMGIAALATALVAWGGACSSSPPNEAVGYQGGAVNYLAVAFVQVNAATPQSAQSTVTVKYNAAQSAGNLNVIAVGWNDTTAKVTSVTDSKGNVYQLAVGPTLKAGSLSHAIYYGKNIGASAAGANTVSVKFDVPAAYVDVRIAEYSGIDTANPVDVVSAAAGTGASSDSGSAVTTHGKDLIVGANVVSHSTTGPGSGFTSRTITSPNSDILEDRVVTAPGTYNAVAPLSGGEWVMQMVAFRAATLNDGSTGSTTAAGTGGSSGQGGNGGAAGGGQGGTAGTGGSAAGSGGSAVDASVQDATPDTGIAEASQPTTPPPASDAATVPGIATYVQSAYAVPVAAQTVNVAFPSAQTAGNLNVVAVGWNDVVRSVNSVTDSRGNVYTRAVGPTTLSGALSQSIYYASNIAAGANTINVQFNGVAAWPDVRVLEYSGIDSANPVDVTAGSSNASGTATSGPATTTNAADLIVAANMTSGWTAGAGAGFTQRILTNPNGDLVEDRVTTSAGSFSGTAPLAGAAEWVMQMVAFRIANMPAPPPDTTAPAAPTALAGSALSASQIGISWTAATDNVGVTGYLVERCRGAGCSDFTPVGTASGTGFNDGLLEAATTYNYRVRATDAANNLGPYSNAAAATTSSPGTVPATPTFVQSAYAVPLQGSTVAIPFPLAQAGGNVNVVVVGWNDSSVHVNSIHDSMGNTYNLAVGPTILPGALTQSIYYAKNIPASSAGSNIVTVQFSGSAFYPDVRILEYSGVDGVNPIDAAVGSAGNSSPSSSGALTTSSPSDLLFAANITQGETSGPGAGFTRRLLTVPNSSIAMDRLVTPGSYTATAPLTSNTGWIMQAVAFRAGVSGPVPPTPPDSDPPVVAITSPNAGATLSGTATFSVTASDFNGIRHADLVIDGVNVGLPDYAGPFSFSVDTTKFGNGAHTIAAFATDSRGNVGSSGPRTVTFGNGSPGNPAESGLWSGLIDLPLVPVSIALLNNKKILMWDGQTPWGKDARVWDLETNTLAESPAPVNIFCSGQEQLADGRIMVVGGHNGGHVGLTAAVAFDPNTNGWTVLPDMTYPRWYPTATTLPDGRLLVLSGESSCNRCFVDVPEIFNPASNTWTRLTGTRFSFAYYPHTQILPDGRVLVSSTVEDPTPSQILDLNALTWTPIGGPTVDGSGAAQYLPNKVIKSGTAVDPDGPHLPSAATAYVLDLGQTTPSWRQVSSMAYRRNYHSMTVLPDGTVLVTGGGPTTAATDTANAILQAELWSPATEQFVTLAPMHAPRLYHSEAILLPDGRVMVSGGGRFDEATLPTDQFNAEFYSPPYLFKGPRPVITQVASVLPYGQGFTVETPDAARIASVSLMRFSTNTHAVNMGQKYVPLSFIAGSGSITVSGPANSNLAPPGYYMLFIVDTNGVPSVAATVRL